MAERDGLYHGQTPDGEPGMPKPPGTGSKGSRVNENLSKSSSTGSGTFRASSESARIIAMVRALLGILIPARSLSTHQQDQSDGLFLMHQTV